MRGLEGAVEGADHAIEHRLVAWQAPVAGGPRERLGIFEARLHAQLQLTHVHGDQHHLRIRPRRVGAEEGLVEIRRRLVALVSGPGHGLQERQHHRLPLALARLVLFPDAGNVGRRPALALVKLARVEHRGPHLLALGALFQRIGRAGRAEHLVGRALELVLGAEHLLFQPRDRLWTHFGPDRVHAPEHQRLLCLAMHVGAGGVGLPAVPRSQGAGVQIVAQRAGGLAQVHCQLALAERQPGAGRRHFEHEVGATQPLEGAQLLERGDALQGTLERALGLVFTTRASELEHGDALDASIGHGGERRTATANVQARVVAERGVRQVANLRHADGLAVERHPHPRAIHVARRAGLLGTQEQQTSTEEGLGQPARARLPRDVAGGDDRPAGLPQHGGQALERAWRRPRRRAVHRQPQARGDRQQADAMREERRAGHARMRAYRRHEDGASSGPELRPPPGRSRARRRCRPDASRPPPVRGAHEWPPPGRPRGAPRSPGAPR